MKPVSATKKSGKENIMLLKIKVITNARRNEIKTDGERTKVYVNAPPAGGRANRELIEFLAGHFGVKKNSVKILRGEKSKNKLIEIVK